MTDISIEGDLNILEAIGQILAEECPKKLAAHVSLIMVKNNIKRREQEVQRLREALELIASKVDNHYRDQGTWINGEWIGVCEIAKQALQQDLTTKE